MRKVSVNLQRAVFVAVMVSSCTLTDKVARAETLRCTSDHKGVLHTLRVRVDAGEVTDFTYMSSVRTPGLATNCTIDKSDVQGTAVIAAGTVTYNLSNGDSIVVKRDGPGWLFDMSKLTAINYCSGIIAREVSIAPNQRRCVVDADGAPLPN